MRKFKFKDPTWKTAVGYYEVEFVTEEGSRGEQTGQVDCDANLHSLERDAR
jgi:hypothetical protein